MAEFVDRANQPSGTISLLRRATLFLVGLAGASMVAGFQVWAYPFPRTALMYGAGCLLIAAAAVWIVSLVDWIEKRIFGQFSGSLGYRIFTYVLRVGYMLVLIYPAYLVLMGGIYLSQVGGHCVTRSDPVCTKIASEFDQRDVSRVEELRDAKNAANAVNMVIFKVLHIPVKDEFLGK